MTADTPRRTVLVAAAAALAGCTVYGRDDDPVTEPVEGNDDTDSPAEDPADGPDVLVAADAVDVGGGVILDDRNIVVTQPGSGEFKAFTAVCTHQGCTVSSVSDGTINCACHGSRFSIEDGSVVQAAAGLTAETQEPLAEVPITVDGDSILAG